MYRRPGPYKQFVQDLNNSLLRLEDNHPGAQITLVGDLNINLLKQTHTSPYVVAIQEHGLSTTIVSPTRLNHRHRTATLIDHILTTHRSPGLTAGTIGPPLADHLGTYTIFPGATSRTTPPWAQRQPLISLSRYEQVRHALLPATRQHLAARYQDAPIPSHPDVLARDIQQTLITTMTRYSIRLPTRPGSRLRPQPTAPWCNRSLLKEIRKLKRLHKQHTANPSPARLVRRNKQRNLVRARVRAAKHAHFRRSLTACAGNQRRRAAMLRNLVPGTGSKQGPPTTLNIGEETIQEAQKIADAMNTYFTTVGQATSASIKPPPAQPAPGGIATGQPAGASTPAASWEEYEFAFSKCTVQDVERILGKLDRSKAAGADGIPPSLVRDLSPALAPLITKLFNSCITSGIYPDPLKITRVIAAYKGKGSDRKKPQSYRPISIVPILAKVLDRLLNKQLMNYMIHSNLLTPRQYAFRPGSNTTRALEQVYNTLLSGKRTRSAVLVLSTDLSKAYDTVSHARLFDKLRDQFHLGDRAMALIRSYFTDRHQSTHTGLAQSTVLPITHGIPQGSCLSTTLFIMYVNDLLPNVPNTEIVAFADDNTLIMAAPDVKTLATLAQSEFPAVTHYMYDNRLALHPTKTKYMLLRTGDLSEIPLQVGGKTITKATSIRTLGVILQTRLKHTASVGLRIQSLYPVVQQIRYARQYLTTQELRKLYFEQAYSRLVSAITIWGHESSTKGYLRPLINLQKRLVRYISKVGYRAPTKALFTDLKILAVPYLFIHRLCTDMHPYVTQSASAAQMSIDHVHHYQKAGAHHRFPTRVARPEENRIQITRDMDPLPKRYATIWNKLPKELRSMPDTSQFSKTLKLELLEQQTNDRHLFTTNT